ncbi:hypothetical protein [Exiguobacterium aurantiacum]|uniref:hypothetical protein n=1 Tax=Exiguobacterium aurantiacum TaxID=33987 RepID=UPI003D0884A3
MNFTTVIVSDSKKIDQLSKKKFFLKKPANKNLSVIHSNKFNDIHHVVFNIEDEYVVSTMKLGPQFNFPYSSLINTFYKHNSKLLLIEHENVSFNQIIMDELINNLKINAEVKQFDNKDFLNIIKFFKGTIKKIEYTNKDDEFISLDFVNLDKLHTIVEEDNSLDFLTINFEDRYLSVWKDGKISIDNNDEKYLIGVVERLFMCIY